MKIMYKEYYFKHKFSYQEAFNHLDNTPFIFTINSFNIDKNWYSKTITLWNEKACKYLEDYLDRNHIKYQTKY